MNEYPRTENLIFNDLLALSSNPCFIHAIACLRLEHICAYNDRMKPADILSSYSSKILTKSEISILMGVLLKQNIIFDYANSFELQCVVDKIVDLLEEYHDALLIHNTIIRESIFYSRESAYTFQRADLCSIKYSQDNDWFLENKGFSVHSIKPIINCIDEMQNEKITFKIEQEHSDICNNLTLLSVFYITVNELSERLHLDKKEIKSFLHSFSTLTADKNAEFNKFEDFNLFNAYPIIQVKNDEYLILQLSSLMESCYETPFYWFIQDANYKDKALENRGKFTECFAENRLKSIFTNGEVFSNIDIYQNKGKKIGEVDVLVLYSDKAIIVQTKSKKLTLASKSGNETALQKDFKDAIQDAYDQGYFCALAI